LVDEKYPWVRWVEGSKRGPAANRNNGAKYANGKWILFIDDDCIPDRNLVLEFYNNILLHKNEKAFEGTILPDDWEKLSLDLSECPVNIQGGCFWSANVCIEKNLFNSIGGFDEFFKIAAQEDQDIYLRLKKNTSVVFIKNAIVTHPVRRRRLKDKIREIPSSLKNWVYFCSKYYSFSRMISDAFRSQFAALRKNIFRGKMRLALYHVLTILQIIPISFQYYSLFKKNKAKL
jgi:GT2 family glycosyltransferase